MVKRGEKWGKKSKKKQELAHNEKKNHGVKKNEPNRETVACLVFSLTLKIALYDEIKYSKIR